MIVIVVMARVVVAVAVVAVMVVGHRIMVTVAARMRETNTP